MKANDYIFSKHNEVQPSKVVNITNTKKAGILTLEGIIVVGNALASCYGVIDDHHLAHTTLAPLRLLYHSDQTSAGERGRDVAILVSQTAGDKW